MTYASRTKVQAGQSRLEIENLVVKHGADGFVSGWANDKATVQFRMADRQIRFTIALPDAKNTQANRQRWRALLLVVKAKIEAVESKIESFDEAFLAHVVMSDGATVWERVREPIALEYKGGTKVPLLPGVA